MTFLRGRPWLVPGLLAIFLGVRELIAASDDSNPTLAVVSGLLAIVGGGLILFSGEHETRKRRNATPRPADPNTDPRIPPTL